MSREGPEPGDTFAGHVIEAEIGRGGWANFGDSTVSRIDPDA